MRRSASFGEGSPLRHPDLFYVGLSNPGGVRRRLEGAMKSFFWRETDAVGGGALVAWRKTGMPAYRTR